MSKKWWIVASIVLLLGCGVCSIAAIIIGTNTGSTDKEPDQIYQIGQDVIVGKVRWKVLAAENLGPELESENQFTNPLKTTGHFILVRVEVENQATEARTFAKGDIVDRRGRIFSDNSDAFRFIEDSERCILERLNPNLPRVCTAIYDLPTDATELKLVVGDLAPFGSEGVIDLGELTATSQ